MTDSSSPPRSFTVTLPRRSHWFILGGFALGLLLFLLLWSATREKQFFRGDDTAGSASDVAQAPLPAPLPGDIEIDLPPASEVPAGERPTLIETRPAPVAAAPAAPTQPAPAAVAAESATPSAAAETPPQRIAAQSPPPEYPASALRAGESGSVLLDVMVDAQGRVTRVEIARRSGSRALDRAALRAVEKWRFTPATVNGQAVPGQVQVPIDFSP